MKYSKRSMNMIIKLHANTNEVDESLCMSKQFKHLTTDYCMYVHVHVCIHGCTEGYC